MLGWIESKMQIKIDSSIFFLLHCLQYDTLLMSWEKVTSELSVEVDAHWQKFHWLTLDKVFFLNLNGKIQPFWCEVAAGTLEKDKKKKFKVLNERAENGPRNSWELYEKIQDFCFENFLAQQLWFCMKFKYIFKPSSNSKRFPKSKLI